MLTVANLSKRLAGQPVLRGLDVTCPAGTITAIRGPNGAGKSTLLRIVAGVLEPDEGSVELDGCSLVGYAANRRPVGYVPEAANPPGHLMAGELIALVRALKSAPPLTAELSGQLGVDRLEHHRIERMSLGERRRCCLAAALVGSPALLVLDEPDNGLDTAGIAMLEAVLAAAVRDGAAVLLATHDHEMSDRIGAHCFELENGRLETALAGHGAPAAST